METVRDLVQAALQDLRVIGAVGDAPAEDAALGLRHVRMIVDEWQADGLMLYSVTVHDLPLAPKQRSRTIGAGGEFNVDRPNWIVDRITVVPVDDDVELPVRLLRREEYLDEPWKTVLEDAYPRAVFYEPTYPLGTLYFFPIPTTAATLKLPVPARLPDSLDLETTLAFPDGYRAAFLAALKVSLSDPYGKPLTTKMVEDAVRTKGRILRNNDPGPPASRSDAVGRPGGFDIYINRWKT